MNNVMEVIRNAVEYEQTQRKITSFLRKYDCYIFKTSQCCRIYRQHESNGVPPLPGYGKPEKKILHDADTFPELVEWILNNLDPICQQYFNEPSPNVGVEAE